MRDVKPEPIPEEALKILEKENRAKNQKESKLFYLPFILIGILLGVLIHYWR